jgi:hypothetical protein
MGGGKINKFSDAFNIGSTLVGLSTAAAESRPFFRDALRAFIHKIDSVDDNWQPDVHRRQSCEYGSRKLGLVVIQNAKLSGFTAVGKAGVGQPC